jgi:adenylate cyclase
MQPYTSVVAGPLTAGEFAQVRRAILIRGAAIAAPVAAFISAYFAVWQPVFGHYPRVEQLAINVAESFGYLVLILAVGNMLLRRWLAPHEAWAVEGQPISDADKEDLVYLPARAATWIFRTNVIITIIGTAADLSTGVTARQTIGYFIGFFLTGFTFAAIVYLQTERALRALYKSAFATALPMRRTVGVLPRLVITWAVGSAIPLLFVAIIPLRPGGRHELPVTAPMLFMALGGLVVGGVTAVLAARSVADPIDAVRSGLQRVRDGDLEAAVDVTRPGALGALQAGFNDMVEAMRSRRQVEDLFGRQVGEEVARHALESGVEMGGELREVSVFFVDLIGSTALAERETPAAVVSVLNSLFDAVVAEVGAQDGWVNKFEGDGCLCVFGAPATIPDHATRALRAARLLAQRLHEAGIDAAIGVSSGEVVAGHVGTSRRFEYTVIGRPVNEAARLTEAAKSEPGRILASSEIVAASGIEAPNWRAHGALSLRGLRDSVETSLPVSLATVDSIATVIPNPLVS